MHLCISHFFLHPGQEVFDISLFSFSEIIGSLHITHGYVPPHVHSYDMFRV